MNETQELQQAIDALEAQRSSLGDSVVDAATAALRAQLATIAASRRQRKQVTILFADVVGSTSMGETRDPETIFDIMDEALGRFGQVVQAHGGRVGRLMGDGLLAFFGAPEAREDDPARAVHAGLAIVDTATAFAGTAREKWGIAEFAVRVGIHTGPVALGEVGGTHGAEYTAMGDTTNVAARLQSAAPPQGVLISHATYCLVRGLFQTSVQPPLQLKGKSEPFQAHLVLTARPRAFRQGRRGVEGIETQMVGRDVELGQLQEARRQSTLDGRLRCILISGDAGIGKSRLLFEFERWARTQTTTTTYLHGRASQDLQYRPYGLIRDIVATFLEIQASDPPDVVRAKMTTGTTALLGDDEEGRLRAHFVGHLLGYDFSDSPALRGILDDARQIHDRALAYLGQFLAQVMARGPALLLLEDLHWADDSSLAALAHLLARLPEYPLCVVAAARPDLWQRYPNWGEFLPSFTNIRLTTLSPQDSHTLVRQILQRVDELPDALCDLLQSQTEGNPFYLEELIKMLIEDGVIVVRDSSWCVETATLPDLRIPATLTGVLQARLDALPAVEKQTLQQASVIGRRFWDDAVVYVSGPNNLADPHGKELETEKINLRLAALAAKELVFLRGRSTIIGAEEYIFKHIILRDVTYDSVLRERRAHYHARAAAWLIHRTGRRRDEYVGLIADHLELAGQTEAAVEYLRQAGEQAAGQYANGEALRHFRRALALLPDKALEERFNITAALERVHGLLGERTAQAQSLAQLRELATQLGDRRRQGEVALRTANLGWITTDYAAAMDAAATAIKLGQADSLAAVEAGGHLYQARIHLRQGAYEQARTSVEQGLKRCQGPTQQRRRADLLRTLGIILYYTGDYDGSRQHFEAALAIYRRPEIQDRQGEAATLNNLGGVAADMGDLAAARGYGDQALAVARAIGDREGEGFVLGNLGSFLHDQGDSQAAITYLEQSVAICRQTAERNYEANALTNLGSAYLNLGAAAQAEDHLNQAIDLYQELGDRRGEANARSLLGLQLQRRGQAHAALTALRASVALANAIGSPNSQGQALTYLGHALLDLDRLEEAETAYNSAIALQADLAEQHLMPEPLAGLARIRLRQNELAAAMTIVEDIKRRLSPAIPVNGTILAPVYLVCYEVLSANDDPEAPAYLEHAGQQLQALSAKIDSEADRQRFLTSRRSYRDIQKAQAALSKM